MKQVRGNVFETNSSSTHSLTLCSAEDYNKWENGELLLNDEKFCTREEAIEKLKKDEWFKKLHKNFDWKDTESVNELLKDNDYKTNDDYCEEDNELEFFCDSFVTKGGETIIAFGEYGFDG